MDWRCLDVYLNDNSSHFSENTRDELEFFAKPQKTTIYNSYLSALWV